MSSSFKLHRELMNRSVPTTGAEVREPEVGYSVLGRSSPAYGPMTTLDQPSCADVHLEPCGGLASDPILECSEPDPLKSVTAAVDSPCIGVCSTTFDDECIGCGRTVSEVAQWGGMADDQKELVWQRIILKGFPRNDKAE